MTYTQWLSHLPESQQKTMNQLMEALHKQFPGLKLEMKWNQPMFTEHGTFILGFSAAKAHFSVGIEQLTMKQFEGEIKKAGFSCTPNLFQIPWKKEVPLKLLESIAAWTIDGKKDCHTFWWESK